MPLVVADRVKETTTTTGQGTVTLLGASTGFRSFAAIGNANTTYYTIAGQTSSEWEVGIGTYTASGTTLSRDTVLSSSAGGTTKTTFSAGTKDVFVTYPATYSFGTQQTLAIANGGSGATTAQTAMNAFAGAVTSGQYLRGNGTNVLMSAIQAADVPTLNQNTTGSAATLTTGRTIAITGDLAYTSPSFNGSGNVTAAGTLATVNSNVGSFTNASVTVNGKGLVTAVSSGTVPVTSVSGTSPVVSSGGATPAISLASGYGDTQNPYASKTANFVLAAPNGTAGVPTFRAVVAADIPTLNQNTTGNATTATTATNLAGGSAGTVPYQSAAGTTVQLAAGVAGRMLMSNGAAAPSWATVNGGTF
jgi:hypothetical protein